MSWLLFAFAGPVCWAVSTHLDKYLVERYFKRGSVVGLMVLTSIVGVLALPFVYWGAPEAAAVAPRDAALIASSGLLYMVAMVFYLQALQTEEASVVSPFFQAAPLFGFVLAYLILGETLTPPQALGAALIVSGGLVLSVQLGGRFRFNRRLVGLMLAAAFMVALSSSLFKFFAIQEEFWPTVFWNFVGQALFGLVLVVPSYRRQIAAMIRENAGPALAVNASNELINLGAGLAVNYAFLLAPVSLVQAVTSTTTLFVFGFGVALTFLFPRLGREDLSSSNVARKLAGAVLVALGIYLAGG